MKGKSAIRISRECLKMKGKMFGRSFWSRGYCVSTVGLEESAVRKYIEEQEKHDRDQEQGQLEFD